MAKEIIKEKIEKEINSKHIFIVVLGFLLFNILIYLLNNILGYKNNIVFYIFIIVYSLLTLYNFINNNIRTFNKIYSFSVGIIGTILSWSTIFLGDIPKKKSNSFKQVRELDVYNSKAIYLIGNITALILFNFIYTYITSNNPSIIFLILLVIGLVFPLLYVMLYETLTFNINKIDLIKTILLFVLIVITVLTYIYLKINGIILLVYFCLLISLIMTIDNKKLLVQNLIIVAIFTLVPIIIMLVFR